MPGAIDVDGLGFGVLAVAQDAGIVVPEVRRGDEEAVGDTDQLRHAEFGVVFLEIHAGGEVEVAVQVGADARFELGGLAVVVAGGVEHGNRAGGAAVGTGQPGFLLAAAHVEVQREVVAEGPVAIQVDAIDIDQVALLDAHEGLAAQAAASDVQGIATFKLC